MHHILQKALRICSIFSSYFQANEAYLRLYPHSKHGVSKLGLSFPLSSNHFVISNGNRVRLKCLASVSQFYWKSAEITLLQEKPKFASVMTSGEEAVNSVAEIAGKYDIHIFLNRAYIIECLYTYQVLPTSYFSDTHIFSNIKPLNICINK